MKENPEGDESVPVVDVRRRCKNNSSVFILHRKEDSDTANN